MNETGCQDESVRHLVELGYTDPAEIAARDQLLRQRSDAALQEAEQAYRAGREPEAIELLHKLAVDDPNWIAPRRQLAAIHYRAGRLNEAQKELDWLAHHGFEHPHLAAMAGHIALVRREFDLAIEFLEYATYVEPEIPGALGLLGTALLRINRLDEADDAFQKSLSRNPLDAHSLDGRSAICLRKREYEAAADHALNALEHDMQLFGAHYHLGIALSHMDQPAEAVTALETATRLAPARAAPLHWLSRVAEFQLHDKERSIAYRDRAKEIVRRRRDARRLALP